MYLVFRTKRFNKSYRKIKQSGQLGEQVENRLEEVIDILASCKSLSVGYKDHQLNGELREYRECHIRGDLLLVYQIRRNELALVLVDVGSHSYLGV